MSAPCVDADVVVTGASAQHALDTFVYVWTCIATKSWQLINVNVVLIATKPVQTHAVKAADDRVGQIALRPKRGNYDDYDDDESTMMVMIMMMMNNALNLATMNVCRSAYAN